MPERFLGDWPKDAFIPFSQGIFFPSKNCHHTLAHEHYAGARACLGRRCEELRLLEIRGLITSLRFFETEGIAIMTMLVSRYKIEVKEEPRFSGETFEERYARITAFEQGLTTT
jgi:hypothetical protein